MIDVNVGPGTRYKNGFFIVILKKNDEDHCKAKGYDLRIDGMRDDDLESGHINQMVHNLDERPKMSILVHVTKVDNDITLISWSILGVALGVFIIPILLTQIFPAFSMIGSVHVLSLIHI